MEFTNRIILKNNTPYSPRVKSGGVYSGNTENVGGGNYLPATPRDDGSYVVNLDNVYFTGNIQSQGEITAFKPDETTTTTASITEIINKLNEVFDFQGDKLVIKKDVQYNGTLEKAEASAEQNPNL